MAGYWAVRELGMSGTSVGKLLGLSQPAVSQSVVRGEKLTQDMNLSLIK
jgi:predicted transcriptional regulator